MKPEMKDYARINPIRLDKTNWVNTLKTGNNIIKEFFGNWQLGFGTLLGAVREEDQFIHHDIDLDIDVLLIPEEEEKIELFEEKMLANNFTLLRKRWFPYNGKKLLMSVAFNHTLTNTIYDVCFFRKWGADYLHLGGDGLVIRPLWSVTSKELDVRGILCYIPFNYEKYLEGRYGGGWKTPLKDKGEWSHDAVKGNLFIPWSFK